MADLPKLVDELSSLAVLEVAELTKLLERKWQPKVKAKVINFYMDDSGTRHPDHDPGKRASHGYDWFALGGVLVKEEDEIEVRGLHAKLYEKWKLGNPIH